MDEEGRPETESGPVEGETDADGTDRSSAANTVDAAESSETPKQDDSPDAAEPFASSEPSAPSGERQIGEDAGGSEGPNRPESDPTSAESEGFAYRFRHDNEGVLMWIREMLSSVAIVLVIGLLLFGVSGVWPPMVAVESGSMEPNMEVGDLVFVTDPGRLAPDAATNDIGVVTHEEGQRADYRTFGSYGSVIIYRPPGRTASPIIHRAMFHVEEGENWYDRADGEYHSAGECAALRHCPAPHSGFITLGDNNGAYDQANGLSPPVKAEWVTGVARLRVPYLGYVRLVASGQVELRDVVLTTAAAAPRAAPEGESAEKRDAAGKAIVSGGTSGSGGGSIAGAVA